MICQTKLNHQSKITCLGWAPDSRRVATGGLDSKIIVWDVEGGPTKKIVFERANVGGISAVRFLSPSRFASTGSDCSVKIWVI
jgi:WD40 repeat protein